MCLNISICFKGEVWPLKTHYPLKRSSFLSARCSVLADINFEVTPDYLTPPFSETFFTEAILIYMKNYNLTKIQKKKKYIYKVISYSLLGFYYFSQY